MKGTETLIGYVDGVYLKRPDKDFRPATCTAYRVNARVFDRYWSGVLGRGDLPMTALSEPLALDVLAWLRDPRTSGVDPAGAGPMAARSAVTRNRVWRHVAAVWRHAARAGCCAPCPEIQVARGDVQEPRAWLMEEYAALLRTAADLPGRTGGAATSDLWLALLSVGYCYGPRTAELLQLRTDWFSPATGWLEIGAEARKQRRGHAVQLSPEACRALVNLGAAGRLVRLFDDFSAASPIKQRARRLNEQLRALIVRAGLRGTIAGVGRKELWYMIRRTCASHIAARFGEVRAMEVMGHSCLQVTRRYIDPRIAGRTTCTAQMPYPDDGVRLRLFEPGTRAG